MKPAAGALRDSPQRRLACGLTAKSLTRRLNAMARTGNGAGFRGERTVALAVAAA